MGLCAVVTSGACKLQVTLYIDGINRVDLEYSRLDI